MEYSDSYLAEFLPGFDPPPQRVPTAVEDEMSRSRESGVRGRSDLVDRSMRWTYAMFSELQQGQWFLRPGENPAALAYSLLPSWETLFQRCAIGLFDPGTEVPGFGVVLSSGPPIERRFERMGDVVFPRLDFTCPLGFRWATVDLHAPIHPANATAACWAQCKAHSFWGILTAGHAVANVRPGGVIALANGHAGQLIRSGHPPVDAAFVMAAPPTGRFAPLNMLRFPAAGLAVDVALRSGNMRRHVVGTMNTLGVVQTRGFAVLSYLDRPFIAGDSGALVSDAGRGALGLYIGSMKTPQVPGGVAGLVQNLEQAGFALNVDVYL